ncbi:transcriptional regulator [Sulfitobacter sp. M57]|uniref:P-II family nitrogen regulator n=1 Tax=unclassified Sulfitobacter TaxID=196795 RepID=UPI0023E1C68B|nr:MULTISPECIES: transcriptional regulator [unclassified Sulfitobacter]MDF3415303.1 transcriptional regulator [Sulfitobacter sp. KE5]MDF3422784.1 transcriptional regulator [Sulfitobacter sp. KE43]MDF3433849.1 transcriptional regulator [Sulfitobacter sp. KE42]MDF3459489.1 transcriptional regulator [Sulfitobacter sp. S74]MDF3463388.1 transcriptional regulator [Sulfitobacter sp. Ks18]
MQTHRAKRVEITIEAVMQSRLTDALTKAGVTGYTVLPVLGGSGRSGPWSRSGQVSRASGMVQVVCIIRPERVDDLLDAAFAVVERHIGIVSVSDCDVLRAERF